MLFKRHSRIRPASMAAPGEADGLAICPHCWQVNRGPVRLCAGCGADMTLLLQESGGLRRTAPVQSPVPVPGRVRLGPVRRVVVAGFAVLIALYYLAIALGAWVPRPMAQPVPVPAPTPQTGQ
jgi:hypothetical protein